MEFKTEEEITNLLGNLKTEGFDRIHLPGGTSLDGSIYAGVVLAKYEPINKITYVAGMPYNSNFFRTNERVRTYKMGMYETSEETAARETLEEVGVYVKKSDLSLVWESKTPDNRPRYLGQFHCKYFYLATEFTGEGLKFEGANLSERETAAPLWIPAELFVKVIFGGHLKAVNAAIKELCMLDKKYAYSMMNLL